jgi:flagellar biosynthetic protein FlhB
MAEADDADKTEEPTHKRLEDARQKGQTASSREINHWFMLLAGALGLGMFGPGFMRDLEGILVPFLAHPETMSTELDHLRQLLAGLLWSLLLAVMAPLVLVIVAAIAPSVMQHGWLLSTENLKPKFEKISPLAGAKRLFSLRSTTEFIKGLAKMAVVATVGLILLWPLGHQLVNLPTLNTREMLALVQSLSMRLLIGVISVVTVIAVLDLLYQRLSFLKRMRMSRTELREEFKQSEGDPMVKGRLRQIRMERARRRMMAAVPKADVVVTNPTHYAVALKYEQASMAAPRVVAKGIDLVAQRIRELAEEHKVPIVANPPLARGLYAAVELDGEIPPEHYKAVAEVISYVMRLQRRLGAAAAPARKGGDERR